MTRPQEPDYTDLEKKYQVPLDTSFNSVIVISNLPQVDESKEAKLISVLEKKIFKSLSIKQGGICMPKDPSTGLSKGFCFIEFETQDSASSAIKLGDGFRLDKSHVLRVNMFDDIEKYASMDDTYKEPELEEFIPKEHLKSWLSDVRARDQFALLKGDLVSIYYNNKSESPELVHSRNNWTDTLVQYSPKGSYLATFHKQGVALWGGKSWNKIIRFPHQNVKLIEFSPMEKYLVSFSNESYTFVEGQEPHNVCVWDIASGNLLRSFQVEAKNSKKSSNPILKWSYDDKYLAKCVLGSDGMIQVYETPSMGLLDKKSIKVEDLMDFSWCPNQHLLSFWTTEKGNIPARVTVMNIPQREIIRTKNLFGVLDCAMYWQSNGEYLLVKVDKIKSKKQSTTYFELFRLKEKGIPVDVVELGLDSMEEVTDVSWEPTGSKFIVLAHQGQSKVHSLFYQVLDTLKSSSSNPTSVKLLKSVESKGVNTVSWSPKGRFVVLAGTRASQGSLYFWDTEELIMTASEEHYSCTDLAWDPTGRYFVSCVSSWYVQTDSGFNMWSMTGSLLTRQVVSGFKQFVWRPRPATLLSEQKVVAIKKNLKDYSKEFDEEDAAESCKASLEVIEKRKSQWKQWQALLKKWNSIYKTQTSERIQLYGFDPDEELIENDEWVQVN